jgi:hypothetical protein
MMTGYAGPHAKCGNGHQAGYAGRRPKTVTTVLGPVRVTRAWYHCGACGHGFAPRDEQLGTAGTALSPGLTQMIARAGAEVPFGKAAALLADLAGVTVTAKTIERSAEASGAAARAAGVAEAAAIRARTIRPLPPPAPVPDMLYVEVDGTGVPMRPAETEGRDGNGEDGHARTQVERWFGLLTDKLIRRGVHTSVQALEHDIREWIATWNANPRPFTWTKTADEILNSLADYLTKLGPGHLETGKTNQRNFRRGTLVADATLVLRQGQITAHGIEEPPSNCGTIVITGGTGRYQSAGGEIRFRDTGKNVTLLQVVIHQ